MLTANGLQPELQTNPEDDPLGVHDTKDDTGTTTGTKATATEQYPPDRTIKPLQNLDTQGPAINWPRNKDRRRRHREREGERERETEKDREVAGGGGGGGGVETKGLHNGHPWQPQCKRPMGALHRNEGGEEEKRGAEGTGADGRRVGYVKCKRPAVRGWPYSRADGRGADGVHSSPGATCMHSGEKNEF